MQRGRGSRLCTQEVTLWRLWPLAFPAGGSECHGCSGAPAVAEPLPRKVCISHGRGSQTTPSPAHPHPRRLGSRSGCELSRVETQCVTFLVTLCASLRLSWTAENVTGLWRLGGRRPVLLFDHLVRLAGKLGCGGPRGPLVPWPTALWRPFVSPYPCLWGPGALAPCEFVLRLPHPYLYIFCFYFYRLRKNNFFVSFEISRCWQWHPTPVLLPGKSHGRRSLVGCSPWGR